MCVACPTKYTSSVFSKQCSVNHFSEENLWASEQKRERAQSQKQKKFAYKAKAKQAHIQKPLWNWTLGPWPLQNRSPIETRSKHRGLWTKIIYSETISAKNEGHENASEDLLIIQVRGEVTLEGEKKSSVPNRPDTKTHSSCRNLSFALQNSKLWTDGSKYVPKDTSPVVTCIIHHKFHHLSRRVNAKWTHIQNL